MSDDLSETLKTLRDLNQPVPRPRRLPTESEVADAEKRIGVRFHADFRRYLLEASDVVYGQFEPVTLTVPASESDLITVTENGRKYWSLPQDYVPICESNADIYCVTPDGAVVFWPHDGASDEQWPNVATWISEVWIGESQE